MSIQDSKIIARNKDHLDQLINEAIAKDGPDCDLNFIDVSQVDFSTESERVAFLLRQKLGYKIPLEVPDDAFDEEGELSKNIFDFIFASGDSSKFDEISRYTRKNTDKSCNLLNELWKIFYRPQDYDVIEGEAKDFIYSKQMVLDAMENNGELFGDSGPLQVLNCTEDIPFKHGIVSSAYGKYREKIIEIISDEIDSTKSADVKEELTHFRKSFIDDGKPNRISTQSCSFVILDKKDSLAGLVSLSQLKNIGFASTEDTFNFEIYIVPGCRGKGYAREASSALLDAVQRDEMVFAEYDYENVYKKVKKLSAKMILYYVQDYNEASKKLAESLGFEHIGKIRWIEDHYDAEKEETSYSVENAESYVKVLNFNPVKKWEL